MIAYVFYAQFHENFRERTVTNLELLIRDYDTANTTSHTVVDNIQFQLQCCGSNSSAIWIDLLDDKYPDSCCEPQTITQQSASDDSDGDDYDVDALEAGCSATQLLFEPCDSRIAGVIWRSTHVLAATLTVLSVLQIVALPIALFAARKFEFMERLKTRTVHEVSFGNERARMLR